MGDEFVALVRDYWPYISLPTSILLCSGGLKHVIYAHGYGYAASMFVNGVCSLTANSHFLGQNFFSPAAVLSYGYMIFGARLGSFLFSRHLDPKYEAKLKESYERGSRIPIFAKIPMVLTTSLLMAGYVLPLYCSWNLPTWDIFSQIGTGLWSIGLAIEALADSQKQRHKQTKEGTPTDGLYRYCRHPNYFGEMLVHTGFYLTAFSGYSGWSYALSAISPAFMCFILTMASKRLDKKQLEKYGDDPKFVKYAKETRSLFPLF